MADIVPSEELARRRQEREKQRERRDRWPPEPPILGEDYETSAPASLAERRKQTR
jgi:hypothetical protein